MKKIIILITLISCIGAESFAQKFVGVGAELSVVGLKANYRMWANRTNGFEVFGGITSELEDFKPNDPEAGVKYLHTIIYNRENRTYLGLMGKWKWMNVYDSNLKGNLPVPGLLIGKEWFDKRRKLKGYAVEMGYQFGKKDLLAKEENGITRGRSEFEEIQLILNFRYSFYTKRK